MRTYELWLSIAVVSSNDTYSIVAIRQAQERGRLPAGADQPPSRRPGFRDRRQS